MLQLPMPFSSFHSCILLFSLSKQHLERKSCQKWILAIAFFPSLLIQSLLLLSLNIDYNHNPISLKGKESSMLTPLLSAMVARGIWMGEDCLRLLIGVGVVVHWCWRLWLCRGKGVLTKTEFVLSWLLWVQEAKKGCRK